MVQLDLEIKKNLLNEEQKKIYDKVIYYSVLPYKFSDHENKSTENIIEFIKKFDNDIFNTFSEEMIINIINLGKKIGFYNYSD